MLNYAVYLVLSCGYSCDCTYVCVDLLVFVVFGLLGLFGVGDLVRLIGLRLSVSVWCGCGVWSYSVSLLIVLV